MTKKILLKGLLVFVMLLCVTNISAQKSPVNRDTITIEGKKYLLKDCEEEVASAAVRTWDCKDKRKEHSVICDYVYKLWYGIKTGSVVYENGGISLVKGSELDLLYKRLEKSTDKKDKREYHCFSRAAYELCRAIRNFKPYTPPAPPAPRKNHLPFNDENEIKRSIDQNNDGICGIYEDIACVKYNGTYYIIRRYSGPYYSDIQVGDISATLERSAANNVFLARTPSGSTSHITFDGIYMYWGSKSYLKMYPTSTSNTNGGGSGWTGTGFALKDGYVVTNNHVVKGATSIYVVGVNGRSTEYSARVVATDSKNDIALIKISDSRFSGFGTIPYSVRNGVADVGSDVFVLGYPMTQYMGEEIKLTNGIISSRSGYQGDMTTYQISAPVQPGNSGGPMFDKNGNVIGIVNAGIPDAENVGYAIKSTYLYNLASSSVSSSIIPTNNTLSGKSLSEKVATLRNFVFYIKCR